MTKNSSVKFYEPIIEESDNIKIKFNENLSKDKEIIVGNVKF